MSPKRQESVFPESLFTELQGERRALAKELAGSEAVRNELTTWAERGEKKVSFLVTRFNVPKPKEDKKEKGAPENAEGPYKRRYEAVSTTLKALSEEPRPANGQPTESAKESLATLPFQHSAFATLIRLGLEDGLRPESKRVIRRLRARIQAKEAKILKETAGLVRRATWRFAAKKDLRSMTHEDLMAEGQIGLLHATEFFDPRQGVPFEAFATPWIQTYAYNALVQQDSLIHLPRHPRAKMNALARALWAFEAEHNRQPTTDELSEATGLSPKDIDLLHPYAAPAPKKSSRRGETEEESLESELTANLIKDEKQIPIETSVEQKEEARLVQKAFDSLPPREKTILCLRLGLDNEPALTQTEVGTLFGFTRQRVKQLEIKAIKQIRVQCNALAPAPR